MALPEPRPTKELLVAAINCIKAHGMPERHRSTRYCLVSDERHYAPKEVVRRAHYLHSGAEWNDHKGGPETNGFLRGRGFHVIECTRAAGKCCGGTGQ